MPLSRVVQTSARVSGTRARSVKVELLAQTLREAAALAAEPERHLEVVADYLAGTLPQRRVGVGWRSLRELPEPADLPTLQVLEVDGALGALHDLAGSGSAATRTRMLTDLLRRATAPEQRWLVGLITGELRQGASDGVLLPALARAADVPETLVRRAVMLAGFPGPVAVAALLGPPGALERVGLEVGRPLRPMLAGSEPEVAAALASVGGQDGLVGVDVKLDGIRLQAHLDRSADPPVRLFTRSLEEITDRLPEVVAAVLGLPADTAVLDGEVIALRPDGRPEPFQVTGARTASSADPAALARTTPVTTCLFDLLHLDGADLLDRPARERWAALEALAPDLTVARLLTADAAAASTFFQDALAAGHEGVVVKDPGARYAAGRRGAGWVKVKPRRTADLVVLAVEQGSGRRQGWLSTIHLGARDPGTGELVMVGKTFKGMSDAVLRWQTERFRELATSQQGHVVQVRPEQVVEIAYDGVQTSRRYPSGIALRFARVLRYRDDKGPQEADTLEQLGT